MAVGGIHLVQFYFFFKSSVFIYYSELWSNYSIVWSPLSLKSSNDHFIIIEDFNNDLGMTYING